MTSRQRIDAASVWGERTSRQVVIEFAAARTCRRWSFGVFRLASVYERMRFRSGSVLFLIVLATEVGCGSSRTNPSYSPDATAAKAFALLDVNDDGRLDVDELKKSPALAEALALLDRNGDHCIDREELRTALQGFAETPAALVEAPVLVFRDGAPLVGATIVLTPEPFMEGIVPAATGVTDARGLAMPRIDAARPGVETGFYRVSISLKDATGRERIPASYNVAGTLGRMISANRRGEWQIKLITK
jgi:EF hand